MSGEGGQHLFLFGVLFVCCLMTSFCTTPVFHCTKTLNKELHFCSLTDFLLHDKSHNKCGKSAGCHLDGNVLETGEGGIMLGQHRFHNKHPSGSTLGLAESNLGSFTHGLDYSAPCWECYQSQEVGSRLFSSSFCVKTSPRDPESDPLTNPRLNLASSAATSCSAASTDEAARASAPLTPCTA